MIIALTKVSKAYLENNQISRWSFYVKIVKNCELFSQENYISDASLGFKYTCEYTKKLGKCFFHI